MCYVRNDGNIVIKIKQLIFKRAGKPSESVLGRLLLYTGILVHIREYFTKLFLNVILIQK